MQPIIIKTVLRSGGEYRPEHVYRIVDMLDKYVDCPVKFVCYSDIDIPDIITRRLKHNWPGWWSKIEIFKDVEESFYIDLDMTIKGDITDMITLDTDFTALRNMNPRIAGIGSAMMKWKRDCSNVYDFMRLAPDSVMKRFQGLVGTPFHGDQGYLWDFYQGKFEFFQDRFPGRIKRFNEQGGDVKVYFGRNRPWARG